MCDIKNLKLKTLHAISSYTIDSVLAITEKTHIHSITTTLQYYFESDANIP